MTAARPTVLQALEFKILGPLDVVRSGERVVLGGERQRALLATLLLHANEVVSADQLLEEVFEDSPRAPAQNTLQAAVSRLRKTLGSADVIVTRAPGYVLRADPARVDALHFEQLAEDGRRALERGDPDIAAAILRDGLRLWRGEPLADVELRAGGAAEVARLHELRVAALMDRFDADLAVGRHAALVGEIETLLRDHPYQERLRGQLMLALYRDGRQAEALDVYAKTRELLVGELGIEPSRPLQQLERAILQQDPSLEAPRRAPAPKARPAPARAADERPARRSRLRLGAFAAAVVVTAAILAIVAARDRGAPNLVVPPNSVAVIDPTTDRVTRKLQVGIRPGAVAAGAGSVWVANLDDRTLTRIAARTQAVTKTVTLGATPTAVAASDTGVWAVLGLRGRVVRVDPRYDLAARGVMIGGASGQQSGITIGAGAAWAALGASVSRIDLTSGKVASGYDGDSATAAAFGNGLVWVTDARINRVDIFNPDAFGPGSGPTRALTVGRWPSAVAAGAGAVWVANRDDDTLTRIDATGAAVEATIEVGDAPAAVAVADDAVWVANAGDGTVTKVDPSKNRVVATIDLGNRPSGLALAADRLWVSVQDAR